LRLHLCTLPCALCAIVLCLGMGTECIYARGGRGFRGGGGLHEGGFSREGPAAGGGFASRSGLMQGRERTGQASRQQELNALQSNREQTAKSLQSSAQQYRGSYPYAGYPAWDAGAGLAAATAGAAAGAAVASSMTAPGAATAGYAASEPCAAPETVTASGTTYYHCGSGWYTQALGPAGPTFVAVGPPPGF